MFSGFSLQNGTGHFFPIYLCKWFTRCRSIKLYILPSKNFIQSKPDESQRNEDGERIWNSSSLLHAWLFLIGKLKPLRKEVYKLGEISSHSPLQNPSLPPKKKKSLLVTDILQQHQTQMRNQKPHFARSSTHKPVLVFVLDNLYYKLWQENNLEF